jgi:hypothetical protein
MTQAIGGKSSAMSFQHTIQLADTKSSDEDGKHYNWQHDSIKYMDIPRKFKDNKKSIRHTYSW